MKLIVVHISGLDAPPREELDARTLLEASQIENLDEMARRGACGTARLLPEGTIAGPGAELLGLLGHLEDDTEPPALGLLEALAIGAPLYPRDVALRVNLSSLDDGGVLIDTTGAGMPDRDALALMAEVDDRLSRRWLSFYPGRRFAHVMVWTDGPAGVRCTPAPVACGQPMEDVLPEGEGDGPLRQLIWDSVDVLNGHRINHERREEGQPPVNVLWPWAPDRLREFRHFGLKTGVRALVVAERLEVLGAARACGIPARRPAPGLTQAARELVAAAQENGLAYHHLDLRDLFEHPDEAEAHVQAVHRLDTELVGPVLNQVRSSAEATRLLVLGTCMDDRWEERPPALWAAFPPLKGRGSGVDAFTEAALEEEGSRLSDTGQLFRESLSGPS